MRKWLIPEIDWNDFPAMLKYAAFGACLAGIYGIAHDQITYTIGPEFFTKLKFQQFHYAKVENERLFVVVIGFLASWWVGLVAAWFLARRHVPGQTRQVASRKIWLGFLIVFLCGAVAGLIGYGYGLWRGPDADFGSWQQFARQRRIDDVYGFARVAYIHNASYLGGLIGLIAALVFVKRSRVEEVGRR